MPNAAVRKQFPGGAVAATLTGSMTAVSTSVDITPTTGWPTGPTPWVVTINRGGATEEQVLVTSRSGSTISFPVGNRGYGATVATTHNTGESIEATIDPTTIDEVNRLVSLPTAVGEMLVFDGTNLVVVSAPAPGTHLEGVDTSDDPKKVRWASRWIPVAATAPAVTAADGQSYYDTTRQELMVTSSGVFKSASTGVVVFATTGDRNALFGSNGVAGRMAWVTADARMYIGTGSGWLALPRPGEWVGKYADVSARDAAIPSPVAGDVAWTASEQKWWGYRTGGWHQIGQKITVSASAPTSPVDGDLWFEPVT